MSDIALSRGRDLERRTALLPGDLSPTEKLAQLEGFLLQGTEVLEKEAGKQPGKKDMYGTELGLRLNHEKSLNIGQQKINAMENGAFFKMYFLLNARFCSLPG